jgi:hypothetical protein
MESPSLAFSVAAYALSNADSTCCKAPQARARSTTAPSEPCARNRTPVTPQL